MNKIEAFVYHAVYRHPAFKLLIRNIYQGTFDLLPRKKNFILGSCITKEGFFFGFHDCSPFNTSENKVLANKVAFDFRMPKAGEGIEIGYFDFNNGQIGVFHPLGTSFAWNYHKGCRLQWIDDHKVIYNSAINSKTVSIIVDTITLQEVVIKNPIDAVFKSNDELLATTFSYERLQMCMPGYGYPYSDDSFIKEKYPPETGLFLLDLKTNKKELIVPINILKDKFGNDNPDLYFHYVTHTEFSQDGRYISFLYRRMIDGGDINRRITMLVVYDRTTKNLILLPTQVSGSHYVWNKRNQIIASCIIDNKSCHVLYNMNDIDNYKIIRPDILNQDGHQTFVNDDVFITDTYPDKWRQNQLYLVDMKANTVKKILNINSPKLFMSKTVYNYIDCDLHPRASKSGKFVCFDACYTGKRSLNIMKLD